MPISIRSMTTNDYEELYSLWQNSEGFGLSDADSRDNLSAFLERNDGLSMVAIDGSELVGALLCGHDGRRGYIHHLAVSGKFQRRGTGQALVESSLEELKKAGIQICHLFVFSENQDARAFWSQINWTERSELIMMSQYS
jgi:ribosomal protein S18 acetylase RimI-like enzyme